MGCLTVKLTRVGGITADAERVGGISCSATRVGRMACRFSLICRTNIIAPYLEISPNVIWVFTDWSANNDVISNTHWNVD